MPRPCHLRCLGAAFRTAWLVGVVCLAAAPFATAHPDLQSTLWARIDSDRLRVAVDVSVREMLVASQSHAAGVDFTELALLAPPHQSYLVTHLNVTAGDAPLTGQVVGIRLPESIAEPESTFVQFELEYPLPSPRPASLTFSHRMLAEWPYAAGVAWNVTYLTHVIDDTGGQARRALLTPRAPLVVPLSSNSQHPSPPAPVVPSSGVLFAEYVRHGIAHILHGFDHLLFVSALVLAARTLLDLVKVVAAFTLAHTLTLALAVSGFVRLPVTVVEPAIALSIVFVAVENLRDGAARRPRWRLAVAFAFGLVHGLGFAGGLLNVMRSLPATETWLALGGFSTGVEIGHQVVVLPLFAALVLARRQLAEPTPARLARLASWAVSGGGLYFLCVALAS